MKYRSPIVLPRRDNGALLPAALAVLLTGMALMQLALRPDVELPPAGPVGAGVRPSTLPVIVPVQVAGVITGRPLFAPRGGGVSSGGAAVAVAPLGGSVVVGSVVVRGRAHAVVERGGRIANVPIGGRIAGWRLAALTASGARFVRGSERLDVNFGSAPVSDVGRVEGEEL